MMSAEARTGTLRTPPGRQWRARYLYPGVTLLLVILAWEVATVVLRIPDFILPPPSEVVREMVAERGSLLPHMFVTASEVLIGFGLSLAIGIPLGVMIVYSPLFERTIYPLLVSSQTIPKIAIAPLFLFWFGFGAMSKIIVALLIAFFPMVISTVIGLRAIEWEMIHLARSMGAGEALTFLKIRLPNALPNIFGGMKVAITLAVVGAVVGEFVGADKGLGYVIVLANGALNTKLLFASIVMLSLLGIVLFAAVHVLERMLLPPHLVRSGEDTARTA